MLSIFRKKELVNNLGWLGTDIQSYLLPGLGEGSMDISTSIDFIKQLTKLGIGKIHFAPHVHTLKEANSVAAILPAKEKVEQFLKDENVNVKITASAEYMVDPYFKITDKLLTLPGNYVLIEMPLLVEPTNLEEIVFNLQISGYKVILAGVERYSYYHSNYRRYRRLKDLGVLFQLNLLSTVGYHGKEEKRAATYLLEHKFYDLAASDIQNNEQLEILIKCVTNGSLFQKIDNYHFINEEIFR